MRLFPRLQNVVWLTKPVPCPSLVPLAISGWQPRELREKVTAKHGQHCMDQHLHGSLNNCHFSTFAMDPLTLESQERRPCLRHFETVFHAVFHPGIWQLFLQEDPLVVKDTKAFDPETAPHRAPLKKIAVAAVPWILIVSVEDLSYPGLFLFFAPFFLSWFWSWGILSRCFLWLWLNSWEFEIRIVYGYTAGCSTIYFFVWWSTPFSPELKLPKIELQNWLMMKLCSNDALQLQWGFGSSLCCAYCAFGRRLPRSETLAKPIAPVENWLRSRLSCSMFLDDFFPGWQTMTNKQPANCQFFAVPNWRFDTLEFEPARSGPSTASEFQTVQLQEVVRQPRVNSESWDHN